MDELEKIFNSDLSDLEKLDRGFDWTTRQYIHHLQGEIELLELTGDSQELVKRNIQQGMMKMAREMFQYCHRRAVGKKAWDDSAL